MTKSAELTEIVIGINASQLGMIASEPRLLQTELARAANIQSLVSLSSPFNIGLIQDSPMAKLWIEGGEGFDNYGRVDKFRYETLLFWWLILHENVYCQKHKGLLDEGMYAAWECDLRRFIRRQNLQGHWQGLKNLFQQDFREHVGQIICEHQNEQASHLDHATRVNHRHES